MPDEIDWTATTYEGNRRRQHEDFHALGFREKLARIEQMEDVAEYFSSRRAARDDPKQQATPTPQAGRSDGGAAAAPKGLDHG